MATGKVRPKAGKMKRDDDDDEDTEESEEDDFCILTEDQKQFHKLQDTDMEGHRTIALAQKMGLRKCLAGMNTYTLRYCHKNRVSLALTASMLDGNAGALMMLLGHAEL